MDVVQLKENLVALGVVPSAYSLDGSVNNETYVLIYENGVWVMFYSEKGLRTSEARFSKECEACEAFFKKISRDHSVLRRG